MKQKRCIWSRTNHFLKHPQEDLLKKIWSITSIKLHINILKKKIISPKYSSLGVLTHVKKITMLLVLVGAFCQIEDD